MYVESEPKFLGILTVNERKPKKDLVFAQLSN